MDEDNTNFSSQDPNVKLKELGRMIVTDLGRIRHGNWGQDRNTGFIRSLLVLKSYNFRYLRDTVLCGSSGVEGGDEIYLIYQRTNTNIFLNYNRGVLFL